LVLNDAVFDNNDVVEAHVALRLAAPATPAELDNDENDDDAAAVATAWDPNRACPTASLLATNDKDMMTAVLQGKLIRAEAAVS